MKVQSRLFAARAAVAGGERAVFPRSFPEVKVGLLGALSHDGISSVQESAVPSNWPILLEFEHLRIPFLCRCFVLSASGSRAEYKEG